MKAENKEFQNKHPAALAELEKTEQAINDFFDANSNMPRQVAEEPAFTENKEIATAQANLKRTMSEPLYDAKEVADAEKMLQGIEDEFGTNSREAAMIKRQIRTLTKKVAMLKARPTVAQHEINVKEALAALTTALAKRPPETVDGKAMKVALDQIQQTGGDLSAKVNEITDQLTVMSSLRKSASSALKRIQSQMRRYKERRDLDNMILSTESAQTLLSQVEFSLASYYRNKGLAVTSVDSAGNINTLGMDRTDLNTSQYYAMKQPTGGSGYMKIDQLGNIQYSMVDELGRTNYVAKDQTGNQYIYTKDPDTGITQYYVIDTSGNLSIIQSQVKYDRRSFKKFKSLDQMSLAQAEQSVRDFLATNPDIDTRKSYRLRRLLDSSETLADIRRDDARYALRYVNNLMSQLDYLEFYDQYSAQMDDRYSSRVSTINLDPTTGQVGIGRTRNSANDLGGELSAGLGLDATALSELMATANNTVDIDGVSVAAGSRSSRLGRTNVGTVTTISADKLNTMLGGLSLDEYLAQQNFVTNTTNDSTYSVAQQVDKLQGLLGKHTALANESSTLQKQAESSKGYTSLLAAEMLAHEYIAANANEDPRYIARLERVVNMSEGMADLKRTNGRYAQSRANAILKTIQATEIAVFNQTAAVADRLSVRGTPSVTFQGVDGQSITVDTSTGSASIATASGDVTSLDIKNGIQDAGMVLQKLSTSTAITNVKATNEVAALIDDTITKAMSQTAGYGIGSDTTGDTVLAVGGALGTIAITTPPVTTAPITSTLLTGLETELAYHSNLGDTATVAVINEQILAETTRLQSIATSTAATIDEAKNAAISASYLNRSGEQAAGYTTTTDQSGMLVNQLQPVVVNPVTSPLLTTLEARLADYTQAGATAEAYSVQLQINAEVTQLKNASSGNQFDTAGGTLYNTNVEGIQYYFDNTTQQTYTVAPDGTQTIFSCATSNDPFGC